MHERAKFNMSTAALSNDLGQVVHISMVYLWSISLFYDHLYSPQW